MSDQEKQIEQLATEAIRQGKTMGQFLRELPDSASMPKDLLEVYSQAYAKVRGQ